MAPLSRIGVCLGAVVFGVVASTGVTGAVDPAVTQEAVDYLRTQQIAGTDPATGSGAWDTNPTTEFATTEVVLAVAEQAQTGAAWSAPAALAAVQGFDNPQGVDPRPFLDLTAGGALTPGKAGKLIVLVASPLGLAPAAFDPAGDGSPVDLVAAVGSPNPDGSFGAAGFFNNTLFAALAKRVVEATVPAQTVTYIRSAQKANGGWSFDGDPSGDAAAAPAEIDTTSLAIQALVAGGAGATDADVREGLAFVASQQNSDGTWSAFGNPSAEATSRAIMAVAAAGYDPNASCWRDTVAPTLAGTPYGAPDAALVALQAANGSIAGPGVFSVSFATAQAVQGLERQWLPVARGAPQTCAAPPGSPPAAPAAPGVDPGSVSRPTSATPAAAVPGQARFTG